jgi:hypothetical protein
MACSIALKAMNFSFYPRLFFSFWSMDNDLSKPYWFRIGPLFLLDSVGSLRQSFSLMIKKKLGMYHVHVDLSCTYHAYKLINFIKKSKNIHIYSFHPTPTVYKISRLNSLYVICNKKQKFLTIYLKEILSFLLLLRS